MSSRNEILERRNEEEQESIVQLKEQLHRAECQARIYYQKLLNYHKCLYDAGL